MHSDFSDMVGIEYLFLGLHFKFRLSKKDQKHWPRLGPFSGCQGRMRRAASPSAVLCYIFGPATNHCGSNCLNCYRLAFKNASLLSHVWCGGTLRQYPVAGRVVSCRKSDEPISIPNAGSAANDDDMIVPFQNLCRHQDVNFIILITMHLIRCTLFLAEQLGSA